MTVMLEVIVVFMATRLVAAARKVDVRMIALVRAMAIVGQENYLLPKLGPHQA